MVFSAVPLSQQQQQQQQQQLILTDLVKNGWKIQCIEEELYFT